MSYPNVAIKIFNIQLILTDEHIYLHKEQILSVCLSDVPLGLATLVFHRHIIICWNQVDFMFKKLKLALCVLAKGPINSKQELASKLAACISSLPKYSPSMILFSMV